MSSANYIIGNSVIGVSGQKIYGKANGTGFQDTLSSMISQVNDQLQNADRLTQEFATGKTDSLHEVMIETEKASISLSFLLQIRTKLLEAYQDIMRMNF